ncbi:MAG: hypothetical protein ABH986_05035 [archaeon]
MPKTIWKRPGTKAFKRSVRRSAVRTLRNVLSTPDIKKRQEIVRKTMLKAEKPDGTVAMEKLRIMADRGLTAKLNREVEHRSKEVSRLISEIEGKKKAIQAIDKITTEKLSSYKLEDIPKVVKQLRILRNYYAMMGISTEHLKKAPGASKAVKAMTATAIKKSVEEVKKINALIKRLEEQIVPSS